MKKAVFGIVILFLGFNVSLMAQNDDVSITYHQAPNVAVKDTSKFSPEKRDEILRKTAIGGTLALSFGTFIYIKLTFFLNSYEQKNFLKLRDFSRIKKDL